MYDVGIISVPPGITQNYSDYSVLYCARVFVFVFFVNLWLGQCVIVSPWFLELRLILIMVCNLMASMDALVMFHCMPCY